VPCGLDRGKRPVLPAASVLFPDTPKNVTNGQ